MFLVIIQRKEEKVRREGDAMISLFYDETEDEHETLPYQLTVKVLNQVNEGHKNCTLGIIVSVSVSFLLSSFVQTNDHLRNKLSLKSILGGNCRLGWVIYNTIQPSLLSLVPFIQYL